MSEEVKAEEVAIPGAEEMAERAGREDPTDPPSQREAIQPGQDEPDLTDLSAEFAGMNEEYGRAFGDQIETPTPKAEGEPEKAAEAVKTAPEVEGEGEGEKEPKAAVEGEGEPEPTPSVEEQLLEIQKQNQALMERLAAPDQEKEPAPQESRPDAEEQARVREAAVQELLPQYALTESVGDALATSPETVVPQMLANVQLHTMQATLEAVQRLLPGWVDGIVEQRNQARAQDEAFYQGVFEPLKEHRADVERLRKVYEAEYPNEPRGEVLKRVGMVVLAQHGLPLVLDSTPSPPAGEQPAGQPTVSRASPYRPAAKGGTKGKGEGVKKSVFEEMAEDMASGAVDI